MELREATLADTEELRRYATELFAEKLPGIFERPAPSLEEETAFIGMHLQPDTATLLLAEEHGEGIGLAGIVGRTNVEERHCGEFGLSVARAHRGRGVGSALLEALLAWAPEHGITRVEAGVCADNPRAVALYERHGFVEEGRRRGAIVRDGRLVDMIMMARLL